MRVDGAKSSLLAAVNDVQARETYACGDKIGRRRSFLARDAWRRWRSGAWRRRRRGGGVSGIARQHRGNVKRGITRIWRRKIGGGNQQRARRIGALDAALCRSAAAASGLRRRLAHRRGGGAARRLGVARCGWQRGRRLAIIGGKICCAAASAAAWRRR